MREIEGMSIDSYIRLFFAGLLVLELGLFYWLSKRQVKRF